MADIYSSAKRAEIMSRVRGRDTRPERTVRSVLHRLGSRFRLNVSGCYWHGQDCPQGSPKSQISADSWKKKTADNWNRDAKNLVLPQAQGWRTVVIWECETKNLVRLRFELAEELGV